MFCDFFFCTLRLQSLPGLNLKYVTNTTKESKRVLMERLTKVGFKNITEDQVFTSLSAARSLIEGRRLRPYFMVDKKAMEDFQGEMVLVNYLGVCGDNAI